ncbi:hypothetical protein SS50377_25991 [Spironucleus salmonicida]|uniref:Uncharacterized protein n=1 Tax=Spironucleus salmonicida TaxID=348837 RepID=V6LG25_9EUKA|nr:hypothetical protein SS50377_25991 [Spironucleus salmonicida]|eukprot:EST43223.1 Hypothetical protein SS50377_17088 [Spironucleus salmonicida]
MKPIRKKEKQLNQVNLLTPLQNKKTILKNTKWNTTSYSTIHALASGSFEFGGKYKEDLLYENTSRYQAQSVALFRDSENSSILNLSELDKFV